MNRNQPHHHHAGGRVRLVSGPVTTRVFVAPAGSFAHCDTPVVMRSPGRPGGRLVAALV